MTCAVYLFTGRGEVTFEAKVRTAIAGTILYLLHIGALKMFFKRFFHYVVSNLLPVLKNVVIYSVVGR